MKRAKRYAACAVVAAIIASGGVYLRDRAPAKPAAEQATPVESAPSAPAAPATAAPLRMVVVPATGDEPAVPPMENVEQLDAYLAQLEADARARGNIDDEPRRAGLAARQLRGHADAARVGPKMRRFAERMMALRRQHELAPTKKQLDGLAARLAEEKDPGQRARLANEYASASAQLPPVERLEAMDRLTAMRL